ncbi:MAG TPA: radical SAM protein [Bacteroidota bacterium]|nr:radical SAM protein [Bacteroidota bacterium]
MMQEGKADRKNVCVASNSMPIIYDDKHHHFELLDDFDLEKAVNEINAPLSVILQITRKCNFNCSFCSETVQIDDPTLLELDVICGNLQGVQRVFLSGGEPLLRKDFVDIAGMFSKDHIVGLPTNSTPASKIAHELMGKISFVNIGLEGPRATTNRVRGDFDNILRGVYKFKDVGIPISFTAVVMRSIMQALPFTFQIADILQAGKLKLILPIRKGNGKLLPENEFISEEEAGNLFSDLLNLRKTFEWRPSLRMTTWTRENEGYSILIYPNGETFAWPVYDAEDKVEHIGNIKFMTIQEIWKKYRFKKNHLTKYLGKSIRSVQ